MYTSSMLGRRSHCCLPYGLLSCFLLLTFSCLGTSLYFSEDDTETVFYCPIDLDTFRINLSTTYRGFSHEITTVYMSSEGYLTDKNRGGLVAPEPFPKYSGTNYTLDCDASNIVCWAHFYYSDEEIQEIQAENHAEHCVNGVELTETFNVYETLVEDEMDPARTTMPTDCISEPSEETPMDYDWMIAAYWQNLAAHYVEGLMWHRTTDDATILSQASQAITALDSVSSFVATSISIFTWDQVTIENGYIFGLPLLSFQVALVTDGSDTYLIYNYKDLSFAAGQAGFDAGDTYNYCGLHYSRSDMSHLWAEKSNVDIVGTWVMKFGEGYDRTICEPLRGDVPYCICDEGWEGRICASSIDDCPNHNCPTESECVDGHLSFTCDFCAGVTCENEGVCESDAVTQSYTCNCVGNHTGDHCEQCLGLTCQNAGVCSNNATTGENTCNCADGYSGESCESDFCAGVTCENEGVCESDAVTQSYTCNCVGNHTGDHCEQCLGLTCQNTGVCSNNATTGENTCDCADGYSGDSCETFGANAQSATEPSTVKQGLTGAEIAGIVVGSLAALAILALVIFYLMKRGKKNQEVEPTRPETARNTTISSHGPMV